MVSGLIHSAQEQASLAVDAPPVATAEPALPAKVNGSAKVQSPPPPVGPFDQRIDAIAAAADTGETEVCGFTVPKPAATEDIVQFSVRIPKTLRRAIHACCNRYEISATQFASLAYELLLTEFAARAKD
jgi:hypothetical protein